MSALPSQLQSAFDSQQGAGGAYAGSLAVDGSAQGQIGNDYATGSGLVAQSYQTGNSAVQTSHSAVAFVGAWGVLADPHASPAEIAAATGVIVATAEGALLVADAYGLLTVAGISMTVPVLGWIVAAVAVVLAVLTVAFSALASKIQASGNPIQVSQTDQVNAAIYSLWKQFPIAPISQNPFTPRSRQIAAYFAAYVQTKRAEAGLPSWCDVAAPGPNAFGYQCQSADAIRGILSAANMLGSGDAADTAFLVLSVLWDPRWRGDGGQGASDGSPDVFIIGTAGDLDPYGGANPEVASVTTFGTITNVTDMPGMSAAAYLCELLAVASLENAPDTAQGVYLATYLRLIHAAWLFESFNLGAAESVAPLFATIGFLAQEMVALGGIAVASTLTQKPTVTATLSASASHGPSMQSGNKASTAPTLVQWVNHYNSLS